MTDRLLNKKVFSSLCLFFFIIAICYFAYLTTQFWALGDDIVFARWMKDGISWQNIITVNGVNGRYLGNALGVIFGSLSAGDFWWIRAITNLICMIALILFVAKTNNQSKRELPIYLCITAILLLSVNEYASVEFYSYSAGFMNYFVPVLLFVCNVFLFSNYLINSRNELAIIICLIAFVNCFFVELISVYLVLSSLAYMIICFLKKNKIKFSICLFLSTLAGLGIMFSYPIICFDAQSVYRSSIFSSGLSLIVDNVLNYSYMLIFLHIFLTAFISFVTVFVLYHNYKKLKKNKQNWSIIILLFQTGICLLGIIISILLRYGNWEQTPLSFLTSNIGVTVISILYLINLGVVIFQTKTNDNLLLVKYFYFSIWVISAILAAVSPIGWRCFFPIYVLFVLIGLKLFKMVYNCSCSSKLASCMVIMLFVFSAMYNTNIGRGYYFAHQVEMQREDYLEKQIAKRQEAAQVADSVNFVDSGSLRFLKDYYYYYNPGDLEISFIPYDDWIKSIK